MPPARKPAGHLPSRHLHAASRRIKRSRQREQDTVASCHSVLVGSANQEAEQIFNRHVYVWVPPDEKRHTKHEDAHPIKCHRHVEKNQRQKKYYANVQAPAIVLWQPGKTTACSWIKPSHQETSQQEDYRNCQRSVVDLSLIHI